MEILFLEEKEPETVIYRKQMMKKCDKKNKEPWNKILHTVCTFVWSAVIWCEREREKSALDTRW